MLDLVASDLLQPLAVPFLRLDGSTPAAERFSVVQRFNADPTIPVLLLTTAVGGLGLNLTAADTVVFLEHDWNPMKDLQVRGGGGGMQALVLLAGVVHDGWHVEAQAKQVPNIRKPSLDAPPPPTGPLGARTGWARRTQ